ncbi:hypothetical protein OEZ85_011381 [Tetradesmus obliquus]|uniref:Uncharacterized protein n=1 Tax=Tetradesmus obliquus TaxID=3088 RepID=A0ABY8TQJ7_TETOB|nr:hypothetical protein OEZ85_011381 [Tetradesmus obliquus]
MTTSAPLGCWPSPAQMPGLGFLVAKSELAQLAGSVAALPRTFRLPEDYVAWQELLSSKEGAGTQWVQKSAAHRGVHIIPDPAAPELRQLQGVLAQQLVRPHLIGGRAWDVELYVAITQLEPLTAYVFSTSVLLRFCSKPYQRDITPDTDTSTYVIDGLSDFTPGFEVDAMRPHYDDAYADTDLGSSMNLAALRSQLAAQGVNTTKWWLDVQAAVVQTLQAVAPKMEAQRKGRYPDALVNLFTLVRFDFMLDEHGSSKLLEVTLSPRLHRPDKDINHQLMHRKLVHDLISLKGLARDGRANQHIARTLSPLKYHMDTTCQRIDCLRQECTLCKICKSLWHLVLLTNLQAEHNHAHGFMRVHPLHRALTQHMEESGMDWRAYFDAETRPDNVVIKMWLDRKCEQDFRWC